MALGITVSVARPVTVSLVGVMAWAQPAMTGAMPSAARWTSCSAWSRVSAIPNYLLFRRQQVWWKDHCGWKKPTVCHSMLGRDTGFSKERLARPPRHVKLRPTGTAPPAGNFAAEEIMYFGSFPRDDARAVVIIL